MATAARLDDLYTTYATGSAQEARQAMIDAEVLAAGLDPPGRENALYLANARLFCVESALGNSDDAYVRHLKVKFWYAMFLASGADHSSHDIRERVERLTEDEVRRRMLEWDRKAKYEKGPAYLAKVIGHGHATTSPANGKSKGSR